MPFTRWVRRLAALLVTLLAAAAFGSAPADAGNGDAPTTADLSGAYPIDGTSSSGDKFTGTVELERWKTVQLRKGRSFTMYKLKFEYSTEWTGIGVGVLMGKRFYFALADGGEKFTVAVLRKSGYADKGATTKAVTSQPWYADIRGCPHFGFFFRAKGDWGVVCLGAQGLENETATLGAGRWSWADHFYDDAGKEIPVGLGARGDLASVALENGALKITRRIWKDAKGDTIHGKPWACVGLMADPETMVIEYGGNGSDGVGYYDIVGRTFEGRLADAESPKPYFHKVVIPDAIVARNPDLFK